MSDLPPGHPLYGASRKTRRARCHLDAVQLRIAPFAEGDNEVAIDHQDDPSTKGSVVRFSVDDPDADLSVVVGDYLFCLRSALDHIVHALIQPPTEHTKRHQFPICSRPENFASEVKSGRLKGVSETAKATIEGLQPYGDRLHPLALLRDLHNVDKHSTLHFLSATPETITLEWSEPSRPGEPSVTYALKGDALTRGTELLHAAIAHAKSRGDVEVSGKAASVVVFKDEPGKGLPVLPALEEMLDYFERTAFPAFTPFFC